jgi:hypothetical protein
MKLSRSKPVTYILIALGILAGFGIFWFYTTVNPSEKSIFPQCTFHSLTGYHCPGCGSQRAIHDFLNFRILEGFKHNALVGLAFLVLLYQLYLWVRNKIKPEKTTNLLYHPKVPWFFLILVILFWILRNLPYEPFNLLAP